MPDPTDGMSPALAPGTPAVAALRRCPGCHNQVTAHTKRCPVCGQHATTARIASTARWFIILLGSVGLIWRWCHHG